MRNFQKIAEGTDISGLLHAVQRQPELWNQNNLRTTFKGTPHVDVDDIWLRFNDTKPFESSGNAKSIVDEHESVNWPALNKLPQARLIIFNLMRFVEGERLGRVLITRTKAGGRIIPHVDGGSHAAYYDRYHVTLQNLAGSSFRCGGESVYMRPGETWWFDNAVEHEVINNSADDRITMIIDIRTAR